MYLMCKQVMGIQGEKKKGKVSSSNTTEQVQHISKIYQF
jgi:hypothetical protein